MKVAATVGEFFARRAECYDEQARLGLPGYDAMLDELTRSLPEGSSRILELGCGIGALTLRLTRRFPDARIHAIDAVDEMIAIAEERIRLKGRLKGRSDGHSNRQADGETDGGDASAGGVNRVSFEVVSFEAVELPRAAFDLVTGSMSLHHLVDKLPFYTRVHESLRDEGYFVFADELTGVVPYIQELHWDDWLRFASQPGHLSKEELDDVLRHCEEFDHYETLPDQLALIQQAGFTAVDCIWRASNYSIFAARR